MHLLSIIKRIRLEPYMFLFIFAYGLEGITIAQLVQDKICISKYNQSAEYCAALSEYISDNEEVDFKSSILADVTRFNLYKNVITSIPVIFWSLFLGSWADRHSSAPKILLSLAAIGSILESALLLLNAIDFELNVMLILISYVPFTIFGGLFSITMSIYSYISSTSTPESKTIRFGIIESLSFVGSILAMVIGGQIVSTQIRGKQGQLHNYVPVLIIRLIAQLLAALWIIFIPLEKSIKEILVTNNQNHDELQVQSNDINLQVIKISIELKPTDNSVYETTNSINVNQDLKEVNPESKKEDKRFFHIFRDIIDVKNVTEMFKTCFKVREDGKRAQIWILFVSLTLIMVTNNGANVVMFQFVQNAFQFDAKTYGTVISVFFVMIAIAVVTVVPLLIKVFKIGDIGLSLIAVTGLFIQNLLRGTILNVNVFYVSFIFGCMAYVPPISVRSKLSNIVDKNEENKVFGLLATFEFLTEFLSTAIYSPIFAATLATYPGIVFQTSCVLLLIPILGFICLDLFYNKSQTTKL